MPYAKLGDPQSLNLYGYVRNNPLSIADPDGNAPGSEDHGGCGGGSAALCNEIGDRLIHGEDAGEVLNGAQQGLLDAQQQVNNLSNVVENETSSLKPKPNVKPGEPGSSEKLAAGLLAVAEIANRVINAGHPGQVAPSTLYDAESAGLKRGDASALDAHGRASTAAEQAVDGSNTTNGAMQ